MCWYHCGASICCLFDDRRNREMKYLLLRRFGKSDLWYHFVFSVFININYNKHGQTPRPVFGLKIQTYCHNEKSIVSVIVMWILSAFIGAANYSFYSLIFNWSTLITISLCVVISSLCYAKIFFTLRGRQFHVQDGAFKEIGTRKLH